MPSKVQKIKLYSGQADASGDATALTAVVRGRILKVELVYDSGMSANCKTAIMAEKVP